MIKENIKRVLEEITENDLVLDIGGWAMPFNRADFVVDIQPYETRGFFGLQGDGMEQFSRETWIIHDISSRERLPFKDKQFDYVICSHTLEDIRDPIGACSEINRVGKKGYIEVPSMEVELTKGVANKNYCGYYHHRWLIDISNNNLNFRFKPHFIHEDIRFHFPKSHLKKLSEIDKISYLFWQDSFEYGETIQISRDKVEAYLYNFVCEKRSFPIDSSLDLSSHKIKDFFAKVNKKLFSNSYHHRYMDTPEYKSK